MHTMSASILVASAVALAGCATAGSGEEARSAAAAACSRGLPAGLAVPPGNELAFALDAEGVQIYSCAETSGTFGWAFKAPEARLLSTGGAPAGTHYAGPTWEAPDGSKVVGARVQGATPDPASIPWLLLRATSSSGPGRMAQVTFVQRVATQGGNPPAEGCGAATAGAPARVPYRALYCFHRAASR